MFVTMTELDIKLLFLSCIKKGEGKVYYAFSCRLLEFSSLKIGQNSEYYYSKIKFWSLNVLKSSASEFQLEATIRGKA